MKKENFSEKKQKAILIRKMEGIKTHVNALDKLKKETELKFREYNKRRNSFVKEIKKKAVLTWEQELFDLLVEAYHTLENFFDKTDERYSKINHNLLGIKTQSERDKDKLEQREKAPKDFKLEFKAAGRIEK